jgi:hypothetical protein
MEMGKLRGRERKGGSGREKGKEMEIEGTLALPQ